MLEITNKSGRVELVFDAKNDGKFRFKRRQNSQSSGIGIETRNEDFDNYVYLEWLIGYDASLKDIRDGKKKTSIKGTFRNHKNEEKHLYELPEIIMLAKTNGLISSKEIADLQNNITGYGSLLSNWTIRTGTTTPVNINGLQADESVTQLPTFFFKCPSTNSSIEVSIEKQQYAMGVQPMVYYCIQIGALKTSEGTPIIGRSSVVGETLTFEVNKDTVGDFMEIVKVFGMASPNHKKDIIAILEMLK